MNARALASVFALLWVYTLAHLVLQEPRQKVEMARPVDFTVVGCGDVIEFQHTSGQKAALQLACGQESVWLVKAE